MSDGENSSKKLDRVTTSVSAKLLEFEFSMILWFPSFSVEKKSFVSPGKAPHATLRSLTFLYLFSSSLAKSLFPEFSTTIISISSVVGFTGNPGQSNYCASKSGIIGFTKSLALEVASRGITVNAVAPGFIQSAMTDSLTDDQREKIIFNIPVKRLGTPKDVANAVNFLAKEDSSYITGQTIHVNGGLAMV